MPPNQQQNGQMQQPVGGPDNDRLMAVVAYVLFFVPLLMGSRSPFVRFHTNQSTVIFIAWVVMWILSIVLSPIFFLLDRKISPKALSGPERG